MTGEQKIKVERSKWKKTLIELGKGAGVSFINGAIFAVGGMAAGKLASSIGKKSSFDSLANVTSINRKVSNG